MGGKLIIIMVGLPARGKSYITKKISNYLNWLNIENSVFNVGNKRRLESGASTTREEEGSEIKQDADFFNPKAQRNVMLRDQLALSTMDDLISYLVSDESHKVGIFDATNSTKRRRKLINNHIHENMTGDYQVLFLESICNDFQIIENNMKLKLQGPDYRQIQDKTQALEDFKKRLENYESVYQTVFKNECNETIQYIKIINIHTIQSHNITNNLYAIMLEGFLQYYNTVKKKIWLSTTPIALNRFTPLLGKPTDLKIISNIPQEHYPQKLIPINSSLDEIHDLILDIESTRIENILIQTHDQFLINGLFKYFKIFHKTTGFQEIDLRFDLICINPDHYDIKFHKVPIWTLSEEFSQDMNRTSSNKSLWSVADSVGDPSEIYTPVSGEDWEVFNYQNLSVELGKKLKGLKNQEDEDDDDDDDDNVTMVE